MLQVDTVVVVVVQYNNDITRKIVRVLSPSFRYQHHSDECKERRLAHQRAVRVTKQNKYITTGSGETDVLMSVIFCLTAFPFPFPFPFSFVFPFPFDVFCTAVSHLTVACRLLFLILSCLSSSASYLSFGTDIAFMMKSNSNDSAYD